MSIYRSYGYGEIGLVNVEGKLNAEYGVLSKPSADAGCLWASSTTANVIQLILGIVACAIAFYVGYNVRAKEENDSDTRYILVEKNSGIGGFCKSIQFLSLYYLKIHNNHTN